MLHKLKSILMGMMQHKFISLVVQSKAAVSHSNRLFKELNSLVGAISTIYYCTD